MTKLLWWLLWIWLMALGFEWLHENFPLYSQYPWEALGAVTEGFLAGAGLLTWYFARDIRNLKIEKQTSETRVKHLEDDIKRMESRSTPSNKEGDSCPGKNSETTQSKTGTSKSSQLTWDGDFYVDENKDSPFCSNCWESEEKAIRLAETRDENGKKRLKCYTCGLETTKTWMGGLSGVKFRLRTSDEY